MRVQGDGFLTELEARASEAPEAIALLSPGQDAVTYGELQPRIDALARTFAQLGLGRRDIVAVVIPDGSGLATLLLAVPAAAICAPLNPAYSHDEVEAYLAGIGARLLISGIPGAPAVAAALTLGIDVLDWEELSRRSSEGPRAHPAASPAADDVAVLIHTSATTGGAKTVPLTHRNLQAMAANTRRMLALDESDRLLSMMPLYHAQGLMSTLAQLLGGGAVICTPGFDARGFTGWLEQLRPTWYTAGPALHKAILPAVQSRPDLRGRTSLRFVRSIGAALPAELAAQMEAALGVPVLEGYGITETGLVTSNAPAPAGRRRGSAGRCGGDLAVGILGENGEFVPPECEGQIAVRGPAVMKEYFRNPEATKRAFHEGWFLTGDLGRIDGEGFLFVTGRIKEIINRGGEKIVPAEVDTVLASHPAVADAAAFGVPHPGLGEDIAAAIVLRPEEAATEAELRRFAAGRLALFKVPRKIHFVDAIPKGSTGKPKREVLFQETSRTAEGPSAVEKPPRRLAPEIEQKIGQIWRRILGIPQCGSADDFFQLGGDSFSAQLMLGEVEDEFGLTPSSLEESEFFLNTDLGTLARIVSAAVEESGRLGSGAERGGRQAVVALQRKGTRAPVFCFPGEEENPHDFRQLAQSLGADQPFYVVRDPRPQRQRGVYTVEEAAERYADILQRACSAGPFVLGGRCYGGIYAYETARRLAARGERVALVVLFEVPAPGYPKLVRHWRDYAREGWRILRTGDSSRAKQAGEHWKLVARMLRLRAAVLWRRLLLRTGFRRVVEKAEKPAHPHVRAGRSYRAGPASFPVVQVMAEDEPRSTLILDDPLLGWRESARGGFTVLRTPGRGEQILRQPHVTALAARLRPLLDRINAR